MSRSAPGEGEPTYPSSFAPSPQPSPPRGEGARISKRPIRRHNCIVARRVLGSMTVPFGIGKPVRRKEDLRLITGRGEFSDDINDPDQVHAIVLRSPHAHAL